MKDYKFIIFLFLALSADIFARMYFVNTFGVLHNIGNFMSGTVCVGISILFVCSYLFKEKLFLLKWLASGTEFILLPHSKRAPLYCALFFFYLGMLGIAANACFEYPSLGCYDSMLSKSVHRK